MGVTKEGATKDEGPEMSDEDQRLQNELEMLVQRLKEPDQSLYRASLESLRTLIRSSTTSMTSVPKPLKFLKPHFEALKDVYHKIRDQSIKKFCADVVSVLAVTKPDDRDCLKFRLLGSMEAIGSWGHEYVRHLSAEVATAWQEMDPAHTTQRNELTKLIAEIVPYLMDHNAEAEACDLLMEVEKPDQITKFVDIRSAKRVCLYLKSCIQYVPDPDNTQLLRATLSIYRKFKFYPDAMLCALKINSLDLAHQIFHDCEDPLTRKQLAFMLARQKMYIECDENDPNFEELVEIQNNEHLTSNFLSLARELDILEPKVAEDVFKTHLDPVRTTAANLDSAIKNLAVSFVNGFVNAGFCRDKLIIEDGNKWIYKNKDHGMISATASVGLIHLWDVDGGLTQIDKYLYSNDDYIKGGALLACGVLSVGIRSDCDPAMALLADFLNKNNQMLRTMAVMGLGLAHAQSDREDVAAYIQAVYSEPTSIELRCISALSLGLVFVGSCNGDITSHILQIILESAEEGILQDTHCRLLALGLGLLYLGQQDVLDVVMASLQAVPDPFKSMAIVLVEACAYAGTGNVLKVQRFLHLCSEHFETKPKPAETTTKDKKDAKKEDKKDAAKNEEKKKKEEKLAASSMNMATQQAMAVLGIALVAMGEDVGVEMAYRSMGHLLRYGEPTIKRTVPLALGLLYASNPKLHIIDTLTKFAHDIDLDVCYNSILALGLVGAGTNNARLSQGLRQLALYHAKDANNLFCVRLAQGLVHLGKGTLSINPYHTDREILCHSALAGLLTVAVCCTDVKTFILGKEHYMLYYLVTAIQPRMLVTLDSNQQAVNVPVRVGQAVDVVGQAGNPRAITGFQTHTTPVLLAYGERAELATNEYISCSPFMEHFVIVQKNPDFHAEEDEQQSKKDNA